VHPCLIPDIRENDFSFSPLCMVGCRFVIYSLYNVAFLLFLIFLELLS
jgi:hypothetical protein